MANEQDPKEQLRKLLEIASEGLTPLEKGALRRGIKKGLDINAGAIEILRHNIPAIERVLFQGIAESMATTHTQQALKRERGRDNSDNWLSNQASKGITEGIKITLKRRSRGN